MNTKIRTMLKARSWTQAQLSYRARVPESVISKIVHGYVPPEATRERIAKALGVAVEELFDGEAA